MTALVLFAVTLSVVMPSAVMAVPLPSPILTFC